MRAERTGVGSGLQHSEIQQNVHGLSKTAHEVRHKPETEPSAIVAQGEPT